MSFVGIVLYLYLVFLFYIAMLSFIKNLSQIPIEQNRCAMACQGCGAVFTFL